MALRKAMLPMWWITMCLQAAAVAVKQSILCGVEYFAGVGAITAAFRALVGPFASFEMLDDPLETCKKKQNKIK